MKDIERLRNLVLELKLLTTDLERISKRLKG